MLYIHSVEKSFDTSSQLTVMSLNDWKMTKEEIDEAVIVSVWPPIEQALSDGTSHPLIFSVDFHAQIGQLSEKSIYSIFYMCKCDVLVFYDSVVKLTL